ncbi:MAG: SPASM domain-containing protein [Clostridia bacterium]|nr:SPASM domain-containing protein [Clostridia bacterium]
MLNEEMFTPLLDLNISLSNEIRIDKYIEVLEDFTQLWGNDIHFFSQNISKYKHLNELLLTLQKLDLATYSFIDGALTNQFNFISDRTIDLFIKGNVNAFGFIINEKLILNNRYVDYVKELTKKFANIETYYKVDNTNYIYMKNVLNFCIKNKIKLCIIDIDKKSKNRIYRKQYKEALEKWVLGNKDNKIKISFAECPYINIFNKVNINMLGGCSAGITSCMIDENGNLIPCMYLTEVKLGNINKQSLKNLWNNDLFNKLRNRNNLEGKCSICKYVKICGGCRAESYYKTGNLFGEDTNCWMEV